ncbi:MULTISPECIES: hypothetical protein [unclassified Flavobacterium]|uniref:hypothetical protein n=1 Tax=unclassified Flavobacterium TaxID=196869 RepID=UPI00057EF96E|nr:MULTISPECIES: hypothetical protein [unclassified Flavobacterium]KIA93086.1 hypothetical protein OA93_22405 [Flavobacterium sp. KMS]KIC00997.1 hypothetical protein OA88_16385 [Flavobacterium sp. JRM]MEA9414532.1 hypothetical protein [Flavobacterium sp. PL02]OUL60442.1 hypothetical protein B8T70_20305 [Flavobacterium sp. AJR]
MIRMYHYATVSKALDQLNEKGFTYDFNLNEDVIKKNPEKFEIVHVYRYEGESDPGDEAVVYGIKSTSGKKGVYVAGFSANSDSETAKILSDLSIRGR